MVRAVPRGGGKHLPGLGEAGERFLVPENQLFPNGLALGCFQAGSGFLKLPAQGVRSGEPRVILILASLVRSQEGRRKMKMFAKTQGIPLNR
ncbi:MAG TPA: hypothetical protein DEO49_06510 [Sutterella sp.]|nr:hypothetical protein [Sutterella sp.]